MGYCPVTQEHAYMVLFENGHADLCYERELLPNELEVDDKLWSEGSGWANMCCDQCGHYYRERVYVGMVLECPVCGMTETIPVGAILEESNLL